MKKFSRISLMSASLLVVWAGQAHAGKIYECNGTYTDKPSANCRSNGSADLPEIGHYTSAPAPKVRLAPVVQAQAADNGMADAPVKAAPSNFRSAVAHAPAPVRQNIQKASYTPPSNPMPSPSAISAAPAAPATAKPSGSSGRRMILEQELNNERRALAEAQAALIRARAVKVGMAVNQQQVSSLQSSVQDRQQNIQALQRELGRM